MASTWKWDASEYARNSSAQEGWAKQLMASLALAGREAVLDIGCGDGKITAELARMVPGGSVLGIDSSSEMIDLARSTFPRRLHPNLDFEVADALSLEWKERFDVAFSNAALHWVRDHATVLRGVAALLKPGGRALFQMGGKGNAAGVVAVVEEMMRSPSWEQYFRGFTFPWGFYGPEEYHAWCKEAGLEVRRVELLPRDMRQSDLGGLAGWMRTTWMPYTQRIPPARREDFIREACERYAAANPLGPGGEISVRMVRLELDARRP